jgi:hypothetical protein
VGAYHEIEMEAREEVLAAGGSISHHHGVGKLRLPFVPDIMSPASMEWRAGSRPPSTRTASSRRRRRCPRACTRDGGRMRTALADAP